MAYIETISPDQAQGELAELYSTAAQPDGSVDHVLQVHGLNPASLRAHLGLYTQTMRGESPLSRAEREMVAVVVSRLNGCRYCLHHHGRTLKELLPEGKHRFVDNLATGRISRMDDRQAAIIDYATMLTTNPHGMEQRHVDRLRHAGLDDRAVLDLAQCVGYFNYVNRIVRGLGVVLEPEGAASTETS